MPRSPLLSGDSGRGMVVVEGSHVPSPLAPAPLPGSLPVQGACGCQLGGKDQGVTLTLRTTPGASPHAHTHSTHGLSNLSPGIRGIPHSLGLILGVFGWGRRRFLLGTGLCTPSITVGAELQPQLCHAEEESSVCFFLGGQVTPGLLGLLQPPEETFPSVPSRHRLLPGALCSAKAIDTGLGRRAKLAGDKDQAPLFALSSHGPKAGWAQLWGQSTRVSLLSSPMTVLTHGEQGPKVDCIRPARTGTAEPHGCSKQPAFAAHELPYLNPQLLPRHWGVHVHLSPS